MTVLGKSAYPESEYMRQESLFAAHRRYDGSRPARDRAKRTPVLLTWEECRKALCTALVLALIMAEEDLVLAMNHPVLRRAAMEEEEDTVITLTAAVPGPTLSGAD